MVCDLREIDVSLDCDTSYVLVFTSWEDLCRKEKVNMIEVSGLWVLIMRRGEAAQCVFLQLGVRCLKLYRLVSGGIM